ncbi:MAG: SpoIID/LytB domain-containing protein, partial [Deltaproteobacteria bacterium]|nr:SpoIID/LytB domain-containing protein [Deltaproteobacteria bacterium]
VITGSYLLGATVIESGEYQIKAEGITAVLFDARNSMVAAAQELRLDPADASSCTFTLPENSIGRNFHWQRMASQTFRGALGARCFEPDALTLINYIGCEAYLEAVICSEMSPNASAEFLKAHCVISRSWVLAQLQQRLHDSGSNDFAWTDASAHAHYDVCNDDHCQRYHGIGAVNASARSALTATRGEVLFSEGGVCDARFSKCCGGITERFSTCWQDLEFPYLQPGPDCAADRAEFSPPLSDEQSARRFIQARPAVFCNVTDRKLLETILPDFDFETGDFFRWQVTYAQDELREIIKCKSGCDFGDILRLEPLSRGASGRIIALRIAGSKHTQVVSKELAIRRMLSPSHLYSSAFVVDTIGSGTVPHSFILRGAGWGHGVGLCQIGAAAMAHAGYDYRAILAHYFQGAELKRLY